MVPRDVLADWRGRKFVLADQDLYDGAGYLIILTDLSYWIPNLSQLTSWCNDNQAQVQGTTVLLPTEHCVSVFLLRWS